jgi:TolB-like protein
MPRLQIKLLGGFDVRLASGEAVEIASRKTRALLAHLALPAGRAHARDRLTCLLWSDRGDKQARDSLRQAFSELGRALGAITPPPLVKNHDTISLDAATTEVDAMAFERLAASNAAGDLHRAVEIYSGDLFDGFGVNDFGFEEWLRLERQRLRDLATTVLKKVLAYETGASAIAIAQRLLAVDPLQEEGHRALMRLYVDAGEVGLALRQYDLCRDLLRRELDATPSAETEQLNRDIRTHVPDSSARGSLPNGAESATPVRARQTVTASSSPKPSIAILPFRNLNDDSAQRYFSDGITEDIITELARFHSLTVIARHSSFRFREESVELSEIARRLDAQYIVEGSVRRAADRLRITARLVEAQSGRQLWSERYDRDLTDLFAVQDAVVQAIVVTLWGRVEAAAGETARRKRTENMAAYDFLLRGVQLFRTFADTDTQPARDVLERAIALDPELAPAYAFLAALHMRDWWDYRSRPILEKALMLANQAVALDGNDGLCHTALGYVRLERCEFDEALFHIGRAVDLNPNDPDAAICMGSLLAYVGRVDEAVEWVGTAFRLNPFPPQMYWAHDLLVLYTAHRYADALAAFNRITVPKKDAWETIYVVASRGQLGQLAEARALVAAFGAAEPGISLLHHAAQEPYRDPADLQHLLDGLRKAGLSE